MGGYLRISGRATVVAQYVPYEKALDQLWMAPYSGVGGATMVIDKASGVRVADPMASPDFSQIVYCYFTSGDPHLWIVNRDGTGDTLLVAEQCLYPAWAPDGSHIIFCSYDNFTDIDRIDPDGTNRSTIYSSGGNQLNRAIYNPQGTHIAFFDENAAEVWVCEDDGSNPVKVGDLQASFIPENAVSWNNAGDAVAFADGDTNGEIIAVNADGTGSTVLTNMDGEATLSKFAWSDDDTTIFFANFDNVGGHYTLWEVPSTGGADAQVSPPFGIARVPFEIYGGRVWADGEDVPHTGTDGLTSILFDGSDYRVDDAATGVRLEFPF